MDDHDVVEAHRAIFGDNPERGFWIGVILSCLFWIALGCIVWLMIR